MPEQDALIDALDPALRRVVGETWRRRAHEELKAAFAFSRLTQELLEAGAPFESISRFSRGVHDEVRHAEVCRALAARYLGEEGFGERSERGPEALARSSVPIVKVPSPPAVPILASDEDGDARVRAATHAVTLGCVNETIAAVFIEASLEAATSPSARATLGVILADEVEHGRAGWIYLSSVKGDQQIADVVQREMATMVRKVSACWFDDACITLPDGAPDHGLPGNDETHRAVVSALRELVLPGFAQLGFDTAAAREVTDRFAARVPKENGS
jgi:hypothetical protein